LDLHGLDPFNSWKDLASTITTTCKRILGIDVDHQNTSIRSILLKKHYIGILEDGKVIIKGMEGKKREAGAYTELGPVSFYLCSL
jgi:DNA polymerase elongation subunit (family B)